MSSWRRASSEPSQGAAAAPSGATTGPVSAAVSAGAGAGPAGAGPSGYASVGASAGGAGTASSTAGAGAAAGSAPGLSLSLSATSPRDRQETKVGLVNLSYPRGTPRKFPPKLSNIDDSDEGYETFLQEYISLERWAHDLPKDSSEARDAEDRLFRHVLGVLNKFGTHWMKTVEPDKALLILNTGGTISCKDKLEGKGDKKDFAPAPGFLFEIAQASKEFQRWNRCRLDYLEVPFPGGFIDSSAMTSRGWRNIATIIAARMPKYQGVVVAHGTDTLAYTAGALTFLITAIQKPIVITGSQVAPDELSSDAVSNLYGACLAACSCNTPEVLVYFDSELMFGTRVTKLSSTEKKAFASQKAPRAGYYHVQQGEIFRDNEIAKDITADRKLHLEKYGFKLKHVSPNVVLLSLYPGFHPFVISAVTAQFGRGGKEDENLDEDLDEDEEEKKLDAKALAAEYNRSTARPIGGIIFRAFGSGNGPTSNSEFAAALRDAQKAGVVVCYVTECLEGRTSPEYETTLESLGCVRCHDGTAEAMFAKLSVLIANFKTVGMVRRLMRETLRGEVYPDGAFSTKTKSARAPRR